MNVIPKMTHPYSAQWDQPSADLIAIDSDYVLMEKYIFNNLLEYSSSYPSGVYPGKMWKANIGGIWYLRCYGEVPGDDTICSNNQREILLV